MKYKFSKWVSMVLIFLLSIVFCQNYTPSVFAEEAMTHEDLGAVTDKVDELTQRVKLLDQKGKKSKSLNDISEDLDSIQDELDNMYGIMDKVERKTIVDNIELGAELRTRLDWFDYQGHDYDKFTGKQYNPPVHERVRLLPSNRFRVNMRSDISDNVKFNGSLLMFKNWADDDGVVYPDVNFMAQASIPTDSNVKVVRAYIDYFFAPVDLLPMAFTFGRIPTTNGLPTDLREDTPRKSTYPGLTYDVETDGVALSINLNKVIKLPSSALRFVYTKRYDDNEQTIEGVQLSSKKGVYRIDYNAMDPLSIYLAQFETQIPGLNEGLLIVNFLTMPIAPPSDLRYNKDLAPFFDTTQKVVSVYRPDAEGRYWKSTIFFETKKFMNTPVDWFVGYAYLQSKAKGAMRFLFDPAELGLPGEKIDARDAYTKYKDVINLLPDMGTTLKALQNAPTPIGFLNNDGVSDRRGWAMHLGFRYTFASGMLNDPKFGVEYNYGSQYWFGTNQASEDPIHKLNMRGDIWDLYYIQPINNYFMCRAGYTLIDNNYDQGLSFFHGQPMEVDQKIVNTYFLFDAKF